MTRTPFSYPTLLAWRRAQDGGRGWNQRKAASALGIAQRTYSRYERRERFVKGEQARRLMDKTGVSLDVLAGVA